MKKLRKILLLILFTLFMPVVSAGSFSVSTSDLTPTVGSTIKVTIKSSHAAGKFTVSSSNTSVLSGGGSVWAEDGSSGTISFKANSAGSATITIVPADVADSTDGTAISGNKTVTITVKSPSSNSNPNNSGGNNSSGNNNSGGNNNGVTTQKPVVKSSINYLSSLSIEGVELSPAFDKETTEYEVVLESGTTSVNVSGTKESDVSYVTGLGDISVSEGVNYISIVVTAENGAKRTYIIKATVLEEDPILIDVGDQEKTLIRKVDAMPVASDYYISSTTQIDGVEIPCYISEITGYTLVALKDDQGNVELYRYDSDTGSYLDYSEFGFDFVKISLLESSFVPDGYVLGTIVINERDVPAYLKDGSYPLLYGINLETGEENFYCYDSSENTIQKFIISDKKDFSKYYPYIIIGLCGLVLFEFIVIIGVIISKNKKIKKALRKKLDTKTDYEKSFDSKRNAFYKNESNITDDLTDEFMSSVSDEQLGHTALISNNVNKVFDNSINRKSLKKEKKANRKKNDDEMFHF